ncbi:ATP-binding protein [Desulfuromonas carbonis]|uniref:sensor histidine kinase n=1 Tax=Desulfuromonas sp. DDH964 TaxID=1823759 RepID=UPI00078D91DA|nr:GAF domain-containing sensor histidine kinase [Desulfuromonas sp. DDH964]AMV73668.1 sensor histidine kinase [Desulfuromonas sp. DDH964]
MESLPFQLLTAAVRIANRAGGDRPRALQNTLRLLKRRLSLVESRLLILAPDEKTFHRQISAAGPCRILPSLLRVAGSNAGRSLHAGSCQGSSGDWFLAVASDKESRGVLVLRPAPGQSLTATELAAARAVAEFLAGLLPPSALVPAAGRDEDLLQWQALSAENDRKFREMSLLYRLSRALHGTLQLNELMHLILSAATVPDGGGFERAMLLMVNARSGTLQGMLGVTRETASMVLPVQAGVRDWEHPRIAAEIREGQRQHPFCRQVMGLRFALEDVHSHLAEVVRKGLVLVVKDGEGSKVFPAELGLGTCVCAPLMGRNRVLALLVVDSPSATEATTPARLRFLELFASQAGTAMENSMLVHRLETAHQDLRESQERLIQGEKMAGLGELAASVAHELKNPLVAIGGFARRLVRQLEGGSREQEYAGIITREVERMERLLGDILAFSKKNMLCFSDCQLAEVIDEALAVVSDALEQAGIRTLLEIAHPLPLIQGDAKKLCQVVINLVDNARQAMEMTGGDLTVRAYPGRLRGAAAVALEVIDTGGGVSQEVLRNIFNPFFTTKAEGTGLGLSISHRIVEHHRGEIEVENRERGAAFIVRLPVAAAEKAFR